MPLALVILTPPYKTLAARYIKSTQDTAIDLGSESMEAVLLCEQGARLRLERLLRTFLENRQSRLKQMLRGTAAGIDTFVILTAENPCATLPPGGNRGRREALKRRLRRLRYAWVDDSRGVYEHEEYPLVVENVPINVAQWTAGAFGQESFIFAVVEARRRVRFELWRSEACEDPLSAPKGQARASAERRVAQSYHCSDTTYDLTDLTGDTTVENYYTSRRGWRFTIPFSGWDPGSGRRS